MKKKLSIKSAVALILVLVFAVSAMSFAYFTDREQLDDPWEITLNEKGIDIRPTDPTGDEPDDPVDPGDAIEEAWGVDPQTGLLDEDSMYPGEEADLTYDLYNSSDMAVDIRETIILTVTDYKGDALALKTSLGDAEYEVWHDSQTDNYGAIDGKTDLVASCDSITRNGNTIVYKLKPFALDGVNEDLDGDGDPADRMASLSYKLVMDKLADNGFQASNCQIDYIIEAKQHADGGADKGWAEVADVTLTIGNNDYDNFVPTVAEQSAP